MSSFFSLRIASEIHQLRGIFDGALLADLSARGNQGTSYLFFLFCVEAVSLLRPKLLLDGLRDL